MDRLDIATSTPHLCFNARAWRRRRRRAPCGDAAAATRRRGDGGATPATRRIDKQNNVRGGVTAAATRSALLLLKWARGGAAAFCWEQTAHSWRIFGGATPRWAAYPSTAGGWRRGNDAWRGGGSAHLRGAAFCILLHGIYVRENTYAAWRTQRFARLRAYASILHCRSAGSARRCALRAALRHRFGRRRRIIGVNSALAASFARAARATIRRARVRLRTAAVPYAAAFLPWHLYFLAFRTLLPRMRATAARFGGDIAGGRLASRAWRAHFAFWHAWRSLANSNMH